MKILFQLKSPGKRVIDAFLMTLWRGTPRQVRRHASGWGAESP